MSKFFNFFIALPCFLILIYLLDFTLSCCITGQVWMICNTVSPGPKQFSVSWVPVRVCIPNLVWAEARQEETGGHLLNCWDQDKTTFLKSHCSGNFGKNSGKIWDVMRPHSTTTCQDFSPNWFINNTKQEFSWLVLFIFYNSVPLPNNNLKINWLCSLLSGTHSGHGQHLYSP